MKMSFSILVENNSGVLSHVSGLFSRRGYNIDSFSAGVTADDRYTRMTIVCSGDAEILEQIEKQLAKLEDVIDIKKLEVGNSVCHELMMVKLSAADAKSRQAILTIANVYHAEVEDMTKDSIILEVIGGQDKLEAFLVMLEDYEILELARTGITGLNRGCDDVLKL